MPRRELMKEVPALLIRGGTSKGVFFNAHTFPASRGSHERDRLISRCFGVPDKTGMQLDGLGGGISSTSKVVFVSKSSKKGFDLDYDFGQVGLKSGEIDWTGNCGNLSSGLLIAARQFGLIPEDARKAMIWQVNVGEGMHVEEKDELVSIPGVPGESNRIDVSFLGAPNTTILPTGQMSDNIQGHKCTLLKGSNPTVFFPQSVYDELGLQSKTDEEYFAWIERVRKDVATRMNVPLSDALRVSFVAAPKDYISASGARISAHSYDIYGRITTPNRRFHHAFTGTGAVNLAMALCIPGTIPHAFCHSDCNQNKMANADGFRNIRIGHPGGVMELSVSVSQEKETGNWKGVVRLLRTARLLMKGYVIIPDASL